MALNRVALAGLLLGVVGCVTVRPVKPAEFIPEKNPTVVWVTYNDNSIVPVAQPRMAGDTLKGVWAGLSEPVSIPLQDIQTVRAKTPDHTKTIVLGAALAGFAAFAVYEALNGGSYQGSGAQCGDYVKGGGINTGNC